MAESAPQPGSISLREVTKTHRRGQTEVHALRGVTAEIPAGSFAFLLGPSGSGKSSLLYLMGGLDDVTGGEISVDGKPLSSLSDADRDAFRRERVGFIFQAFNLLGNLDAVDNVLVPFLPKGVPSEVRKRAVGLLEQVGLGDRLDHRPNQLSGGEQQRVAIARALLKDPQIVLADEPTGELDTETGQEIFAELRRLHAAGGTTVVVVTHDRALVQEGDLVFQIRDGRIVEG
ncbi:MAG: ABC transporter ATP-binding protein [Planctomycetota bacterium]